VNRYILTASASDDLREIISYRATEAGEIVASRIEDELFSCFENLARHPGIGHRRSDLTSRPFVFFSVEPYLIIYEHDPSPVTIHAILHSARDVKRLLRKRTF
jgi:plasmid stabilization system protein ParE